MPSCVMSEARMEGAIIYLVIELLAWVIQNKNIDPEDDQPANGEERHQAETNGGPVYFWKIHFRDGHLREGDGRLGSRL